MISNVKKKIPELNLQAENLMMALDDEKFMEVASNTMDILVDIDRN